MTYNYRSGDKTFFKVVFGNSHIPLELEEAKKLSAALLNQKTGLMIFKMGMVDISKIAGIFPDYERMEDWNINEIHVELPNLSKDLMIETPQDRNAPRIGQPIAIDQAMSNKYREI